MKKVSRAIVIFAILVLMATVVFASGGNISGWKDEHSEKITYYNGKYYGYHNEAGVQHYHQVEWSDENKKWEIVSPSVYYEKSGEGFRLLHDVLDKELLEKEVVFNKKVDGDTVDFIIDGQIERVRFLGINTPETVAPTKPVESYGREASEFTKRALENARNIRLEFEYGDDIFSESSKNRDRYGRLLAWVFVDDVLLQEELIKNGLAHPFMVTNSQKYAGRLQRAEEYAKEMQAGVWSIEGYIAPENKSNYGDDLAEKGIIAIATIILGVFGYVMSRYYDRKRNK